MRLYCIDRETRERPATINVTLPRRLILPALFAFVVPPTNLTSVDRTELCVTSGSIAPDTGTQLEVTDPEMRAVLRHQTDQDVEVKFKYVGLTTKTKKLKSGQIRQQFGLKLRAADSCNLVYAMWRIKPASEAGLVVSVKRNEGLTSGKQCGNSGYHTIKPTSALKVAAFQKGKTHAMRAEMTVRTTQQTKVGHLQVWIDHKIGLGWRSSPDGNGVRRPRGGS